MLKIGTFNTHANGTCEVNGESICSFDGNLYGDMVGSMSINSVSTADFIENIEAIKADFCTFIEQIAEMAYVANTEKEEVEVEEETPLA